MAISLALLFALLSVILLSGHALAKTETAVELGEAVLTLDAANFSDVVAKHQFIVVEFYAPWCGHCKQLAPEYEKAAAVLRNNDPPVALAKVDAYDERNKEIKDKYQVHAYPTIKIIENGGSNVRGYGGPRDAEGIVQYLKKQVGPASIELRSAEVAQSIGDKGVVLVGVFPEFAGVEYENFMAVAEKKRSDYDFFHTSDAGILPHGDQAIKGPVVRLFKPFDELFVDSQDFDKDALEKFIEVSGFPTVVTFDADPTNHKFLERYYSTPSAKAMLFLNFSDDRIEAFKSQIQEAAKQFSANNISFLIGDVEAADRAFQYFGLKENDVPLLFVIAQSGKYLNPTIDPDQVIPWLKQYIYGNLTPYVKSEPIPKVNDQPVKVVVADSIDDIVFNSGKNVLLEFYAPWCGHCRKLDPILEAVAVSLQDDEDVVIAKMDGTANDIPTDFAVEGYPTIYFYSTTGDLYSYNGGRTAEDIIKFIKEHKGPRAVAGDEVTQTGAGAVEEDMTPSSPSELLKDEL
ncbi:hypothetical protein U9M48_032624 [Paspalum notatum var. saurae]|uniref:Protein disulfide-isomerase n=1 Tax=Paspalum notatum var. saurae TaxID=547442 RepID=A0AAQ3X5Z5_PASNO